MDNNKLDTITNLFEGKEIRSIWDSEKEEYFFSVIDIISALTESNNPRNYWNTLKRRVTEEEKSELYAKCVQLKMKSPKDGKNYLTDTLDTKGILRLIESIPSPNAEPFKLWLAQMGKERIDEVFDPELAVILTNEIYQEWSGMKASQYKEYKGLRKESLRDNMTDIEVALTDLGEITTRELVKKHKPYGLDENRKVAKMGGHAAKVAREDIEKSLGESVVTKKNALNYKYIEDEKSKKKK